MIADMVHNFLLPEVNKQMMRQKIRDRQQGYLREAHSMIYNETENLKATKEKMGQGESSEESDSGEFYNEEDKVEKETAGPEDSESEREPYGAQGQKHSSENADLEEFWKEQSHSGKGIFGKETESLNEISNEESHDEDEKRGEEYESISEEDIDIYNEIKKYT